MVFAALVHDFGKGVTPAAEWPQHIGHEGKGADMVKAFCQRFRVPNEYRDLGVLTAKYHTHCHRAFELKPSTLLRTLESMDAFRKPKRVYKFVLACEADFRGRKGFEDRDYPEGRLFQAAFEAAAAVDGSSIARELQALEAKGEDIAKAIHEQRLKAVQQAMKAGV